MNRRTIIRILGLLPPFLYLVFSIILRGKPGASTIQTIMIVLTGLWGVADQKINQGEKAGILWRRALLITYLVIGGLGVLAHLLLHRTRIVSWVIWLTIWVILPGVLLGLSRQDS